MLWIIDHLDQLSPAEVLSHADELSPARRERVRTMRYEPSKVRSVLAELLLRYALWMEYGLRELPRIGTGELGKPCFPDRPDLQFSLSHCDTAVVCALDASPLGVDAERWRGASEAVLARVLSPNQRDWVRAGADARERDRRFTRLWTCKEAYGKALGCGISYDLREADFPPDRESWTQDGWHFFTQSTEDYALSLCSRSPLQIRRLGAVIPEIQTGGNKMQHFLIVVDMQKDFVDGALGTPEAQAIVPAAVEKIRSFDGRILATYDTHHPDYLSTREGRHLPVVHCVRDTPGWALDSRIQAALDSRGWLAVEKPTFGSMLLPQLLRDLAGEENFDVELIGLCTDICVVSNALLLKAAFPEKDIFVDPACCAGVTPELHAAALRTMGSCQINLRGE